MKNWLIISIIAVFAFLAGCSSNENIEIEVTKPLTFSKDKEMPFEVKVTEDGKAVEGLEMTAQISMVNMDHGTVDATFEEVEVGLYSANVKLSMAGDWEVVYTIDRDGKTFDKVNQYKVEKSAGVATINGELITTEDIEFYRFINKLHISISRSEDEKRLSGKELEEANAYWDSQEKLNDNQNQLLTQIIRLRAMALLGQEKGHEATSDEVEKALETVRAQYGQHEIAQEMIKEYGVDRFWLTEEKQYQLIVLSQKVQGDLVAKVKEENPNVNDQEISFLAQKEYEELLVSQVNSLEVEIF
jgi:hypothetical protein